MNEQQAIEEIVKETCGACMGSDSDENWRCDICGYKKAIEALEKQIPKKPIVSNCAESNTYRCKCGRFLKQIYFDRAGTIQGYEQAYCPGCGQAIDWSVEE